MESETAAQRVFREDVLLFINGCFAATGQSSFYRETTTQRLGIEFVHEYMLHGYRRVYALTLAAGINHFNTALIIRHLLALPKIGERHPEENALITSALRRLPPQRVYRLFRELRRLRVNNRRARAIIRSYVEQRGQWEFDAMKYRRGLASAARHTHFALPPELGNFLFLGKKQSRYERPLLEAWRAAHYAQEAMYRLPFTVAEGFAAKHGVAREVFLKRIAQQMTRAERERSTRSAGAAGVDLRTDAARMPLWRLASYVLSLPMAERETRGDELEAAFIASAGRVAGTKRSERVALVLDDSYSAVGTRELRQRPLAVALGAHYLIHGAFPEARSHWLHGPAAGSHPFCVRPVGPTCIADVLLRALEDEPELVFIVSDGWENDPPGATDAILELYDELGRRCVFVHGNPVFDGTTYEPRRLARGMATVGIRQPEDLLTCLSFARFALGKSTAEELERELEDRASRALR